MKAAIYCRVSTDEQGENNSLPSQLEACSRFAERQGFTFTDDTVFYEDESGMKLDRPELNNLRKLIKARKVDVLIVHTSSRLTRQVVHGEIILDELFTYGVRLFIAESNKEIRNTPDDRDFFIIENVFNRRWRNMILEAMMRNKQHIIRSGRYLGLGLPAYGYTKTKIDGYNALVIMEEQAAVVRNIFRWFAIDRITIHGIIQRLKGVPTPNDERGIKNIRGTGTWSAPTLRKILHNETYAGVLWQKVGGEKVAMVVDPIIDRETWELAQKRLDENKQTGGRRIAKYQYLMGKRLFCNSCGLRCHTRAQEPSKNYFYYVCNSFDTGVATPKCGTPSFHVQSVDTAVWEWVVELMENPKALRESLEKSKAELDRRNEEIHERLAQIDKAWKRHEERIERLLAEYSEAPGEHTKRIVRTAIEQAEQMLTELSQERETLQNKISGTGISDSFIRNFERYARRTRGKLHDAPFAKRRKIVEELQLTGEIAIEEGQKVIYLKWHIYEFTLYLENNTSRSAYRSRSRAAWSVPQSR